MPGDRCVVFFDGDDVYNEQWMIWPLGESQWMILTPDGDLYAEYLDGSRPDVGPRVSWPLSPEGTLPEMAGRGCYRFTAELDDDDLKRHIRAARVRSDGAGGAAGVLVPSSVRNATREVEDLEKLVGGGFVPTRLLT